MKKVAVVGGGITGLTAAFYLRKAGFEPLVYEARKTPGGVIQTRAGDGFLAETGPNSLQETPEIGDLIEDADLRDEVVEAGSEAKNRYIVRNGRLLALPMSPPAMMRSPLLSWSGKLRILREPLIRPRREEEPEESLADFVRRRLGEEALDYLVNPFVGGIFAGDPEKLSARYAMPRLFEAEQKYGSLFGGLRAKAKAGRAEGTKPKPPKLLSFRRGLGVLPAALAQKLDKRVYRETVVESIRAKEGGWELIAMRYGRRLRDTYDAIVLALPVHILASLKLEKDEKSLGNELLGEMPQPPVASVSLGFERSQVGHPLDGFGMLLPEREGRQILGTLFASTLFPGRAPENHVLLTTFVGGARQPELARASPEELKHNVLTDLRSLLGIRGDPVYAASQAWPRAIPQYTVGHGRFLNAIERWEAENPGLFFAGPVRDGISVGQCIASGRRRGEEARLYLESQ